MITLVRKKRVSFSKMRAIRTKRVRILSSIDLFLSSFYVQLRFYFFFFFKITGKELKLERLKSSKSIPAPTSRLRTRLACFSHWGDNGNPMPNANPGKRFDPWHEGVAQHSWLAFYLEKLLLLNLPTSLLCCTETSSYFVLTHPIEINILVLYIIESS